ncbi:tyrosine-type recombinase/integrase [Candidatus Arsenophonus triatominarum]|uniref:tyrosine-type recombinase/integrase n=1 Tax=Candidatus Arsenophonus triatominarum TaxID=57911 RepID=UPI001C9CEE93
MGGRNISSSIIDNAYPELRLTIIREQQGHYREYVFTYQGNRIKNAGAKGWRKAVYRAGLGDFHFHDLRHTWATRHIMAGTPL